MGNQQLLQGAGLDAVIGMYPVVHRLRSTVVTPVVASALGDPLVRAPRSVLLYGPPRCGASFIAHKLATEIEELAGRRVIHLNRLDAASSAEMVAQVMADADANGDLVVATCHHPWELAGNLAAAFDRLCFVHPPDWEARRFRIWESSVGRALDEAALEEYVTATEGWCGKDVVDGIDQDAVTADAGLGALTEAWLTAARTWALCFEREFGVDDFVAYMQRMRRW
ncbi:MAG: ATP-binding protein [Actinobacteria bacterium]|nr:ATP-binding protein [Actinomycetota bacterium]